MNDRLRAFLEALMPWYDDAAAHKHDERTEAIRQRSIKARQTAERVRAVAADRLGSYHRVRVHR